MSTTVSDDPAVTARPQTSLLARPDTRGGIAQLKPEYIITATPIIDTASPAALNDVDDRAEGRDSDGRDSKRRKVAKKERKGQNKGRSFPQIRENVVRICKSWETTGLCDRGETCKFKHDWSGYFEVKPHDISFHSADELRGEEPYVVQSERIPGGEDAVGTTLDLGTECFVMKDLGLCPFGWRCRFLGGHVEKRQEGVEGNVLGDWVLQQGKVEEEKGWTRRETNWINSDVISQIRNGSYEYPFSSAYLAKVEPEKSFSLTKPVVSANVDDEEAAMNMASTPAGPAGVIDGESEAIDVPLRPEEKKSLNWKGGLYLAPLTTVGNLPFRRLCTTYGATITISEMALAKPLISGHSEEFALLRRHESEKTFGVQLAGCYANQMVPAAEMIRRTYGESGGVDFVDVNMGCPIDLVFNQGAGSALMDNPGRLGKFLVGMNRALGDIPLTIKFRTGVANNKPNAHKLIPRFASEWGISAMTLHGRSRQQRYSKLADWDYIKQCADGLRAHLSDEDGGVSLIALDDAFTNELDQKSGVDGVMVARGALIKPWIFTEIAERREWDISAVERLDGIRKFAEFGLSHWGSDTQGVNITRRFLCEALSFQHRYVPIGLLETLPGKLNERPPAYRGRNELETLLSSPFSGDWVKISEMFLGKPDASFQFLPKHKSNAYDGEVAQG
ncbi:tRNA-dihydrouridine synthase 3, partial [Tremellales sp. Uapishka_1]